METSNHVVIEYYFPKEGKFESVMNVCEKSLEMFENGVDGIMMAQILKPTTKNGPIGMLSIWDSKESLGNMLKNMDDSLKKGVAEVKEMTSKIEFQMFDGVKGWHAT